MHLQAPTLQAFGCKVRCTYAGPPGGSCWNAIATAPIAIGAPAAAGCMRACMCMEGVRLRIFAFAQVQVDFFWLSMLGGAGAVAFDYRRSQS